MGQHQVQSDLERADYGADGKIFRRKGKGWMFGFGDTPPPDGTTGWHKGALFLQTDASTLNSIVFINIGSDTSSDFDTANLDASILASVENGEGASLIGFEDAATDATAVTVEAALAELFQHIRTVEGMIYLPVGGLVHASDGTDGTVLALHASGSNAFPGTWALAEGTGVRWNNLATPFGFATCFVMPPDVDITANMVLHLLASKTGTEAAATTFGVTAFNNRPTAQALYDADADFGGASSAMPNPGIDKAVEEVTLALAAANLAAFPNCVTLTIRPTAGTLTTDDVILHAAWIEYKKKLQTV